MMEPAPGSHRIHSRIAMLGLALFAAWHIFYFFFGERIQVHGGLGWDGVVYARIAADPEGAIAGNAINKYYTQRILPPLVVHYSMKALGHDLSRLQSDETSTKKSIADGFYFYNLAMVLFALFFWWRIAEFWKFGPAEKMLSFACLFFTYPLLKLNLFYPILSDTSAFTFGLAMFNYFLRGNRPALLITTALGAFVFPTLLFFGILLVVFDKKPQNDSGIGGGATHRASADTAIDHLIHLALKYSPFLIAAGIAALATYMHYFRIPVLDWLTPANRALLPLSIAGLGIYLLLAFRHLLPQKISLDGILSKRNLLAIAAAGVLFVLVRLIIYQLSNGSPGPLKPSWFAGILLQVSCTDPFVFLVCHVMYYGPAVMLILIFWKSISAEIQKLGLGFIAFTALVLILSIGSESRQIINVIPVFVLLMVKAWRDAAPIQWPAVYLIIGLQLMVSKCWLVFYPATLMESDNLAFPNQIYFMSQGPWMNHTMYGIFLAACLLMIWPLLKVTASARRQP